MIRVHDPQVLTSSNSEYIFVENCVLKILTLYYENKHIYIEKGRTYYFILN